MPHDADLELLLSEALRERPKKAAAPERSTAEDYALRLAEKALYRKLLADPHQDARRFVWWFGSEGADGLSLDQWRDYIDTRIQKAEERARRAAQRNPSAAEGGPQKLAD